MSSSYIGKVVDNYRILTEVGIGGMGVVFKAIHMGLDKIVALKMIAPGMAMNANFIRRFQTEAKALARLQDPNIVQIFDLRSDNDQWFIVMEFVDGGNLSDYLRDDGGMPVDQSINIVRQVLSALGHAHKAGIIHRDIKPNNVMLTNDKLVKITDFGLAKDQDNIANTVTVTGGGTLYYMSPEHVKGFSFTDHRSDIYSIGMTFYEMISGNVPFKNLDSDFDIREMIVRKEMVPPKTFNDDIPEPLEAIIMKSIAKSPDDRYQSCEEMIADLDKFESGDESTPELTGTTVSEDVNIDIKASKSIKKHWWWAALIPMLLVLYFSVGIVMNGAESEIDDMAVLSQVELNTYPEQALVLLNDDTLSMADREQLQLPAGQYRIRTEMSGYKSKDTLFVLHSGEQKIIKIALNMLEKIDSKPEIKSPVVAEQATSRSQLSVSEIKTAAMEIESTPSGAVVWINGQNSGTTPFKVKQLSEGAYDIQLRKSGFRLHEETAVLSAGLNRKLSIILTRETGLISISTAPPGALAQIDGESIGNGLTPLSGEEVSAGSHQLTVSLNGFESIRENIQIKAGEKNEYSYALKKMYGNLIVRIRPWGSVYINNQLKKATTDFKYEIELPATRHLLKVSHPTLGIWEREIQIEPDHALTIAINFNKSHAISVVAFDTDGSPIQAEILLDNKPTGELTPGEVSLRTGLHRLSVIKNGYIAVEGEKDLLIDDSKIDTQKFILQKIE